jgi:hypothetical protein
MKRTYALLCLLLFAGAGVYAQFPCTNVSNVIPCTGFVLGQLQAGTIGSFTAGDEWTTIGKGPFPSPGTGDFPYGQRYQRGETTTLYQIEARNGAPAILDGVIGIGAVRNGASSSNLPRLDFDYVYQNQSSSPPSVTKIKVMTITAATSKPLGMLTQICFPGTTPCFGRVGIENTNPSYTLDVNGLIRAQTTIYTSDARFKRDIKTIDDGMKVIQSLRGTTYQFKDEGETPGFTLGGGLHAGFIAQEMENVLPHLVYTDDQGYKGVDYVGVIPYLVEGFKGLAAQNEAVMRQNAEVMAQNAVLEAKLDALLGQQGNSSDKGLAAGGSMDATGIAAELFQNVPNPTSGATEIRFSLPETVRAASLLVFDMNGKQLRSYDIRDRGLGNVAIAAGELSSGMYLYTLLADGKEIGTRRMIITE